MVNVIRFRSVAAVTVAALVFAILAPAIRVGALNTSSLLLSDPRSTATGVTYTLSTAGLTTGSNIQCIQLDIGTAVDGSGDAGLNLSSLTLSSETISSGDTWSVGSVDGVTDQLRAVAGGGGATPNASGNVVWGGIVNGATEGTTYYGLFETYNNIDCSTGGAIDSTVVAFIYKDGELVTLTIDPTLTFTCTGVASAASVNGATTTVASGPAGIDHQNNVTFAAKGISAHDIAVGTNATGGYSIFIRHTGLLSNGSDTITNHTGTNAAPTSFPAAGTEAWGYTTQDGTLTTGTADRFTTAGGDLWSGFNTSNELVADNPSAPTGVETTRIGHQVGVSAATPAGTYQTTIIYTVASVY